MQLKEMVASCPGHSLGHAAKEMVASYPGCSLGHAAKEMVASYPGCSHGHAAKEMSKFILSRMMVLCTVGVWQGQLEDRRSSFTPLLTGGSSWESWCPLWAPCEATSHGGEDDGGGRRGTVQNVSHVLSPFTHSTCAYPHSFILFLPFMVWCCIQHVLRSRCFLVSFPDPPVQYTQYYTQYTHERGGSDEYIYST